MIRKNFSQRFFRLPRNLGWESAAGTVSRFSFTVCWNGDSEISIFKLKTDKEAPLMGLEPTTSELEVQRAIRCATAAELLDHKSESIGV